MKVRRIDHIGIIVDDLAAAKTFFLELGLGVLGEMDLEGELVDKVTGLKGVRSSILMMGTPGGGTNLEFSKIHTHPDKNGIQRLPANALGLRHVTFAVEDIEGIVAKLEKIGGELFSPIQNYNDVYKLCYMRGPEGIIVELAEEIG
jgi:catechol 2,3-dioxygenase-like lactoylglutathione lyase family enzyme